MSTIYIYDTYNLKLTAMVFLASTLLICSLKLPFPLRSRLLGVLPKCIFLNGEMQHVF
jgi:hypothetical protein